MSTAGNAHQIAADGRTGPGEYERIGEPSERAEQRYDSLGRRWVPRVFVPVIEPIGEWTVDAICTEVGGDLWFPDHGSNGIEAKRICQECPVITECLEYAMRMNIRDGIWGGLGPMQRAKLHRERNAA